VNIRECMFIKNEAAADSGGGKHGHQIMTRQDGSEIPSVTIVNTNFTDLAGDHPFSGYDGTTHGADKYVTPTNCTSNPCTVSPFTGDCYASTSPNQGVLCNYTDPFACPTGSYNHFVSTSLLPPLATPCSKCAGHMQVEMSSGTAGLYVSSGGDQCVNCPAGKDNSDGSGGCDECGAGQYSPAAGTACSNCTGHNQVEAGTAGVYVFSGGSSCESCKVGKDNSDGSGGCDECGAGQYSPAAGMACSNCTAGKDNSDGSGGCDECGAGQYSPAAGTACSNCTGHKQVEAGTAGVYVLSGGSSCESCKVGKDNSDGSGGCDECLPGYFSASSGTKCKFCPAGNTTEKLASSGATMWGACNTGKF
jgi:hypothetical protein